MRFNDPGRLLLVFHLLYSITRFCQGELQVNACKEARSFLYPLKKTNNPSSKTILTQSSLSQTDRSGRVGL